MTAPPPATTGSRRSTKQRDPWFDNAKMALVTLVVVGHSWVLLPDNVARLWFYDFLYLWHIPAFVLVTGYLSRSFTWSRRHLGRLLTMVVVPYLIFEAGLTSYRKYVLGENLNLPDFIDPHWPMWYLTVLFLWRLATPLLRFPAALPVAVLVSLVGGLTSGDLLDIARALGLLPFFVLGLMLTPEHVAQLRRPRVRVAGALVLAAAFPLAALIDGRMRTEWLYWRSSYAQLDASFAEGVAMRSWLLVVSALLALSFLVILPRRDSWFSRLGAATLVVYLFHGFAVKTAKAAGFGEWAEAHQVLGILAATGGAIVLALLLAAPPVARVLNVAVDPVGTWQALRRRRQADQAPVTGP